MKIIVFSNSSFLMSPTRLGLQMLALEFAKMGHEIDYIPTPSNPFDFLASSRKERWSRAWLTSKPSSNSQIHPNLTEHYLKAPFPRNRKYWFSDDQIHLYSSLFPSDLAQKNYDLCIYDTSFSSLLRYRIQAQKTIFRLNDNPEGFSFHMHPMVIEDHKNSIRNNHCDSVWYVSDSLKDWTKQLNPEVATCFIPNGVDLPAYTDTPEPNRRPNSVVYLGAINQWFDSNLVDQVAAELPDWNFSIYGPDPKSRLSSLSAPNIEVMGPIPFEQLPQLLKQFQVGIIPFSTNDSLLKAIDPLKAYPYLAASLGIACTEAGNLRNHLEPIAEFGDSPSTFATAIKTAAQNRTQNRESKMELLRKHSWKTLAETALNSLSHQNTTS